MDLIKKRTKIRSEIIRESKSWFLVALSIDNITTTDRNDTVFEILGTDLDANGNSTNLPMRKLAKRSETRTIIEFSTNSLCIERVDDLFGLVVDVFVGLSLEDQRNDDDLNGGNTRRKNETTIITMNHDHDTNRTSRKAPRVLNNVLNSTFLVLKVNIKVLFLRKVCPQAMTRCSLNGLSTALDKGLNGRRVSGTSKLFLLRLSTSCDGYGEEIFISRSIVLEDFEDFTIGVFLDCKRAVSFLPEEFAASDKGNGVLKLPSNDVAPLIETERKIAM